MSLDIGAAVEEGARRTLKRNGLMLVAAFFLLNLSSGFIGARSGNMTMNGMSMWGGMGYQPLVGNPLTVALLGVVVSLLSIAVSIAALRVFVTDETEVIPDDAFKRNIGSALLHTIVGGIIFAVIVGIGLMLLVIPGIYLLLALFFWTVYVAVEDETFYDAMKSSWELTKDNKWRLLGLLVVIAVVNVLLSVVGGFASIAGYRFTGMLLIQALSAFGGVFALAAQARAYEQLK